MDIDSGYVKEIARGLGADLCGIASADRFGDAPEGFHPRDVLPGCKAVIVLAVRFNNSTLQAASTIPYTVVRNELSAKMNRLAVELSSILDESGITAVPTGSIGPDEFDRKTDKFRGIISLKHAAVQAGLGKMGKNTLLVNDKYGNMLWLNAVITSAELEADPVADYESCIPGCTLCIDSCPVKALDGISIKQPLCKGHAFGEKDGGEWRIKCYTCRKICPRSLGIKMKRSELPGC